MFLETISLFHETHFCLTGSGSQDLSNNIYQPQANLSLEQVEGGILRSIRLKSVSLHHFSYVFKLSLFPTLNRKFMAPGQVQTFRFWLRITLLSSLRVPLIQHLLSNQPHTPGKKGEFRRPGPPEPPRRHQKTAYEIDHCDWSSDVCSSDLIFSNTTVQKHQFFSAQLSL